jgi:hypothetical protein
VAQLYDLFYFRPSWTQSDQVDMNDSSCIFTFDVTTLSPYHALVHAFILANGLAAALWCNCDMIFDLIGICTPERVST